MATALLSDWSSTDLFSTNHVGVAHFNEGYYCALVDTYTFDKTKYGTLRGTVISITNPDCKRIDLGHIKVSQMSTIFPGRDTRQVIIVNPFPLNFLVTFKSILFSFIIYILQDYLTDLQDGPLFVGNQKDSFLQKPSKSTLEVDFKFR